MNILIVGPESYLPEVKAKFPKNEIIVCEDAWEAINRRDNHDVVFDFVIDETPEDFQHYAADGRTVFVNACKISLSELSAMADGNIKGVVFGFNGMPTLFNRAVLEVSFMHESHRSELESICAQLGTEFVLVDDRVGLATPRVISMIINEAYYTVQEGTATREDVDLGMKLGTNYPFGPFEWCSRIGIKHVFEVLEAVYEDTKDERYKICPMLKREYLRGL